jgi:hypothetical protein
LNILAPVKGRASVTENRSNRISDTPGELYELCDRAGIHFGHYARAVYFHSLFPGSEICGNLLVEPRHYYDPSNLLCCAHLVEPLSQ